MDMNITGWSWLYRLVRTLTYVIVLDGSAYILSRLFRERDVD